MLLELRHTNDERKNLMSQKNYEWFKNNLTDLMKKYRGKYLIIIDEALSGYFETFDEAICRGSENGKTGGILNTALHQ
ncbi:MAG: hypothetical protein LBL05_09615 [Synergistaceae bacterium]|nr:hypothetical protein [Synergistaceae bacterium]